MSEIKRAKRVLLGVTLFLVFSTLSACVTKYFDLKLTVRVIAREFLAAKSFRIERQSIDVIGISDHGDWHIVLDDAVNYEATETKLQKNGFRPPTDSTIPGFKCFYHGDLWLNRGSCPIGSLSPCWVTICIKDGDRNVFIDISGG